MVDKKDELLVIVIDSMKLVKNAKALKGWDKANKDIKLGAIGLLGETEEVRSRPRNMVPGPGKGKGWFVRILVATAARWSAARWRHRGGRLPASSPCMISLSEEQPAKDANWRGKSALQSCI
jgi:hypothetical protein